MNILRLSHHHYYSPEFIIEDLQEKFEQACVYLELMKSAGNWVAVQETETYIGKLLIDIQSAEHSRN